jgi:hypothetical protein
MARLPRPLVDVFELGPATSSSLIPVPDLGHFENAKIVAANGTSLGTISRNPFDIESISNQYGVYGSRYSAVSIFNPYGPYGGEYSSMSPFNQYTTTPPRIIKGGKVLASLTVNKYVTPRVDPQDLLRWLNAES